MKLISLFIIGLFSCVTLSVQASLPAGFVYLQEVDPSIIQEMRYASNHNFVGRPIKGYQRATCILSKQAAFALQKVQRELRKENLSLKVYDCYRPVSAVEDFVAWSKQPDQKMKKEFYPREDKKDLFKKGYIAERSGHSRGSTVDLTIVHLSPSPQMSYKEGQPLVQCYAAPEKRFQDNSIDMGSGYDCLDPVAYPSTKAITSQAHRNRMLLQRLMIEQGFEPYEKEWWHFTLKQEPYPVRFFNFPVK